MSISATKVLANRFRIHTRFRRAERLRKLAMERPFLDGAHTRLLLVSQSHRIPQSQIFPFHHYAKDLKRLYGAQVREIDISSVLSGEPAKAMGANVVAFQTPFDIEDEKLWRLLDRLNHDHPKARMVYLDWSAPTDLRNAERLDKYIDVYVKKHVLRNRLEYSQSTIGETNLSDFYSRRFGVDAPIRLFNVTPDFLRKLVVGPSFATAPGILPNLLGSPPPLGPRPIDLHARFAVGGTAWYQLMRAEAEAALSQVSDLVVIKGNSVGLARFLVEMQSTKIVFSPFGYGEVCWRDYEAVMAGAVLLKPDMSHIETNPDIFVPWETYVPLKWDLSDFDDCVRQLVTDTQLRHRISRQAFDVLHRWLASDNFAKAMAPLFEPNSIQNIP